MPRKALAAASAWMPMFRTPQQRLRGLVGGLGSGRRFIIVRPDHHDASRYAAERISQLTQRTNQFNLTTRRYSVAEIRAMLDRDRVYTMAMRDRFSDYGTVAVVIARDGERLGEAEVDSLLMSCRAFGCRIAMISRSPE